MLNRPKRILFLTFYYYPDLCAGSFRAAALMEAFKELLPSDYKIDIVTTMPNRYKTFKVDAKEYEEQDFYRLYRIPLPKHQSGLIDQAKSFTKYFFAARKIVHNNEYDLVIATSSRLFTAVLGATVSKGNVPLYLDIRDIFTDTMNEVLTNNLVKSAVMPILQRIEKFTFNRANHINLVSKGFQNYFESQYSKDYSYFTNGIDAEFLNFDYEYTKKDSKSIITYAGNIGEGQGLHIIIPQAAKELEEEFIFRIIGDGGAKHKLEKIIAEMAVTNVQLINPVNRKELKRYYRESDYLFLHLNNFKAFEKVLPSKIFEYAVTNKPIIGGVGGYASTFLTKNLSDSIVFEPGDVNSLVIQLRNFQLQKLDRSRCIDEYSRVNVMRKMVAEIKEKFIH